MKINSARRPSTQQPLSWRFAGQGWLGWAAGAAVALALLMLAATAPMATAQVIVIDNTEIIVPPHPPHPPWPPHPPHPPRPWPVPPQRIYKIESVDIRVDVRDQAARFQMSQVFKNTGNRTLEAQLVFPVPPEAAISGLTLLVDGKELTGKLMKKDEARRIYEQIVRRRRDPALLEYLGYGLLQTSVFPVPPGRKRTVQIRYTQLLGRDNGLVDLLVPIGTIKHARRPVERLGVTVRIETTEPLKSVYSPTHSVDIRRPDNRHAVCSLTLHNVLQPDDMRLLFGAHKAAVGMDLISYRPKTDEDGYFVLLASPDLKPGAAPDLPKTVVFVLDRSGSMSGKKIDQARRSLKFLLQQLKPHDTFNIVAYDSEVESFRPELQKADHETLDAARGFVEGLYAGGSTNIDGALRTAMRMLTDSGRPSYVLFLTDGLPTVGEQNEMRIASNAKQANRAGARLFCFGVGFDVNSRLLDRLTRQNRGQSFYVRPNEDIEAPMARLASRLAWPVMTDLAVAFDFDAKRSASAPAPVARIYPHPLPDLFRGEQLVLVGRYRQSGPAKVTLSGKQGDKKVKFARSVRFVDQSVDDTNAFVAALWATRRIGEIIDELDLHGHNQELVDELVRLSLRYGIITPYTAFLAEEDTPLADRPTQMRRAAEQLRTNLAESEGRSGFLQRDFKQRLKAADQAAPAASPIGGFGGALGPAAATGAALEPAEEPNAQLQWPPRRIGSKTFYWKGGVWRDASVTDEQVSQAVRIEQFSKEYFELAGRNGGRFGRYLAFTEPVLINLDGTTYRIEPPQE